MCFRNTDSEEFRNLSHWSLPACSPVGNMFTYFADKSTSSFRINFLDSQSQEYSESSAYSIV
jgi:hypothetical protein